MKIKKNSGVSLTTVVITVIVMIILASVTISYSLDMIDDSGEAKSEDEIYDDNEVIRALLTQSIIDEDVMVGYALLDNSVVVITPEGKEYGTGYYLIPGGKDDGDLGTIKFKLGDDTLTAYKGISEPYVVDSYTGK